MAEKPGDNSDDCMVATVDMINGQGRILIVEDSLVNQKMLTGLLEKQGYEVEIAGNPLEASRFLEHSQEVLPDLILLDILMPEMDGFEFCGMLKQDKVYRDIPVIFISSLGEASDKVRGFELGGVDYITKPFYPGEVLARIHTHLKLCRLQRQLEVKNRQLNLEKQKSEALLLNVLPARVAQELIEKGSFSPQSFDQVTVCFVDIVQFTAASSLLRPVTLIRELNDIFSGFDAIAGRFGCERMKTVGDAYLFTCGLPEKDPLHVHKVADAAWAMIGFLKERNEVAEYTWQVRIGIHTGSVVGGIVGTNKYLYDIFGDTVNIASRLESLAPPMKINVSQDVRRHLRDDFIFAEPVEVEMKGKGRRLTYLLDGRCA